MTYAEKVDVQPNQITIGKALTACNEPLSLLIWEERYSKSPYRTSEKTAGADMRYFVAAHAVMDRLLGIPIEEIPPFVPEWLKGKLVQGLLPNVHKISHHLDMHCVYLQEQSD